MNDPRYAALAARLLGREPLGPMPTPAAREQRLAAIERALAARERRRPYRTWLAGLGAAAASALVWVTVEMPRPQLPRPEHVAVVASPLGEGARRLDSASEVALDPGLALQVGGRIATAAHGGARLELSTGTHLELLGASTLTLKSQDQLERFELTQGGLSAHIAKLAAAERFVVDTPDAQIEVRGTVFHLRVLPAPPPCGERSRTQLEVEEGVVEVRHGERKVRVTAGQHWPLDCTPDPETAPPAAPASADSAAPGALPSAGSSAQALRNPKPIKKAPSASRSVLTAQTDLFAEGVRAQREGDKETALRVYADLLQRYPTSPLAENALVERMRLLAPDAPAAARQEAQRYLESYPNGFARAEAQRLAEHR